MNKVTNTTITQVDGKRYILDLSTSESTTTTTTTTTTTIINLEPSHGFIVDTKPDDKVYRIQIEDIDPSSTLKLYIGSQDAAHNLVELQNNNIRSILNVGFGIENIFKENHGYSIEYCNIDILDDVGYDIKCHFKQCFEFIDRHQKAVGNGGTLVHCNAGISRSVTLAIAYMMQTFRIPFEQCLSIVRKTRVSASPNQGFKKQLLQFEKELEISN
eukprot:gene9173-11243_t